MERAKPGMRLYPLLFGVYPVLFLFQHNFGYLTLSALPMPLLCAVALALMLYGVAWLLFRQADLSAAQASFWVLWFFAYGHIMWLGSRYPDSQFAMYLRDAPLLFWGQVLLVGTLGLWFARKAMPKARRFLLATSVVLVGLTVVQIGWAQFQRLRVDRENARRPWAQSAVSAAAQARYPDIYYLVLDTHTRQDILRTLYHGDNTAFLAQLRRRGFYVATESYANYNQTLLSMASSLNMTHLQPVADRVGRSSPDIKAAIELVQRNEVAARLKARGYTIISLTEYWATGFANADVTINPMPSETAPAAIDPVPAFEEIVLSITPLEPVSSRLQALLTPQKAVVSTSGTEDDRKYQAMLQSRKGFFDALEQLPAHNKPIFVCAHTLAVHSPLLCDEHGQLLQSRPPFSWEPGLIEFGGVRQTLAQYEQRYARQLSYIDARTLQAVDAILRKATRPTVIIIQGDHGPAAFHGQARGKATGERERFAILNACYFSDGTPGVMRPDLTPVNTFRVIFNRYFGANYDLLPDRSYFSPWNRPYAFEDMTEIIRDVRIGKSELEMEN